MVFMLVVQVISVWLILSISHAKSSTVTVTVSPSRLVPVIVSSYPPSAWPALWLIALTVGMTLTR